MYCRHCGQNIPSDSAFCSFCGKSVSVPQQSSAAQPRCSPSYDDKYYEKKAARTASHSLISLTSKCCCLATAVFLIFNIGMSSSLWAYILTSVIMSSILLGLRKLLYKNRRKFLAVGALILSFLVALSCVGFRIVYDLKADSAKTKPFLQGDAVLLFSEDTEYYNSTGTGEIKNPKTTIKIDGKWYDSGDKISVTLNKKYSVRVSTSGTNNSGGGYIDTYITFAVSSFSQGKCKKTVEIEMNSGPATLAVAELTFERYIPFWSVIFS